MLLFDVLGDRFDAVRFPRRWDGKNVSRRGTLTSGFRTIAGTQPGVSARWALYATAVSAGHLWIGRQSVYVDDIAPQSARSPSGRELVSLDHDFTVIPLIAGSGASLEWALRSSAVSEVLALLDARR